MSLEEVRRMEYPGRFIILGRNLEGENVAIYGITGRSAPSKARRLFLAGEGSFIKVVPTDRAAVSEGDPELLIYTAIFMKNRQGLIVGNGKQTSTPIDFPNDSIESLFKLHEDWEYEPDSPNFTPRISGIMAVNAGLGAITRASDGSAHKKCFGVPLIAGEGRFLSTYSGENKNPLPSFEREPYIVSVQHKSARESAEFFYELFEDKYRVSVAAVHANEDFSRIENHIVNKF